MLLSIVLINFVAFFIACAALRTQVKEVLYSGFIFWMLSTCYIVSFPMYSGYIVYAFLLSYVLYSLNKIFNKID